MRKIYFLIATLFGFGAIHAQPANDLCSNAIELTVGVGSCSSIEYTNVGATTTGNPPTPACWSPNNMSHTVWFYFVATSPSVEVSTNFGNSLNNTQLAAFSGSCGSLTQIACNEDINTASGLLHTNVQLHGLTVGNTYYLIVDGNGNSTGGFGICVQEIVPLGPPLPTQDCPTAQFLCTRDNISVPNGPGATGLIQERPSCFGAPGERSSWWYSFTAGTSGTLCFTITPNTATDYDFAVFNTTNGCLGTELSCNWAGLSGAGITGLGCSGTQCNPCINVVAGQTYSILVDRWTSTSSSGFTLNFSGTTATFASPNPSFTSNVACHGSPTQFTNTTLGSNTYSWNFGDGNTSSLENPTHTYAAPGTYTATLLVTTNPGGCQNVVSNTVTVNPIPTVDAGTGASVCAGQCVDLSGSASVSSGTSSLPFFNSTTVAIPNNSTVGANTSVSVVGAQTPNCSIASVCFTLNHTEHSDIGRNGSPDAVTVTMPNGTIYNSTITPLASFNGTRTYCIPLSVFSGYTGSLNGTWTLNVKDTRGGGGGTGSITNFAVTMTCNNLAWTPTQNMTGSNTLTPQVCPTETTIYTLTAWEGGCSSSDQVTVMVSTDNIEPLFTQLGPYCQGSTPDILPSTSTNGITGTWDGPISTTSTGVFTYTFTPNPGQCASVSTMQVEITETIIPLFTQLGPYCPNQVPGVLPTTSSNGITGSWNASISTATPGVTTYTFTPDPGQCANTATMDVEVLNETIVPLFTQLGPYCVASSPDPLPTVSTNGITGSWNASISTAAPGVTTYTFTPDPGQCALTATMDVEVDDDIPAVFTQLGPYCEGETPDVLPTVSNNGITGGWDAAISTATSGVTTYIFTPDPGQCSLNNTEMNVEVLTPQLPLFDQLGPYCPGETADILPTTSTNGITGSWNGPISTASPGNFTYTFTPNSGQCATVATMDIVINDNTILPLFDQLGPYCPGETADILPTTSTNGITGSWNGPISTASPGNLTYTFTPDPGQCALIATMDVVINDNTILPLFDQLGPYCEGATPDVLPTTSLNGVTGSWNAPISTASFGTFTFSFTPDPGQCATSATMEVVIIENIIPTFTQLGPYCVGATPDVLPATSNNGITGSWNAPISTASSGTTTYTFTPDPGQCASSNYYEYSCRY
jgi:hypothetical protein